MHVSMKVCLALAVLCLALLMAEARPRGGPDRGDRHGRRGGGPGREGGHGRGDHKGNRGRGHHRGGPRPVQCEGPGGDCVFNDIFECVAIGNMSRPESQPRPDGPEEGADRIHPEFNHTGYICVPRNCSRGDDEDGAEKEEGDIEGERAEMRGPGKSDGCDIPCEVRMYMHACLVEGESGVLKNISCSQDMLCSQDRGANITVQSENVTAYFCRLNCTRGGRDEGHDEEDRDGEDRHDEMPDCRRRQGPPRSGPPRRGPPRRGPPRSRPEGGRPDGGITEVEVSDIDQ